MTSFLLMSHHISKLLTSFLRGAVCNIRIDRLRYFSIYVDESIPNDKQAISEAINLSIQKKVGEGITASLKEPLETEYTLTLIDGQPTQANHIFGRMIQVIE
ncbi:hypothetical protein [Enterococcus faecalis]|uniref:hypothetical protein n=1 Tax=Enterococcus faecalis TaxID=1351 RepID=UPI00338FD58F